MIILPDLVYLINHKISHLFSISFSNWMLKRNSTKYFQFKNRFCHSIGKWTTNVKQEKRKITENKKISCNAIYFKLGYKNAYNIDHLNYVRKKFEKSEKGRGKKRRKPAGNRPACSQSVPQNLNCNLTIECRPLFALIIAFYS